MQIIRNFELAKSHVGKLTTWEKYSISDNVEK